MATRHHPEQGDDEVYFGNADPFGPKEGRPGWKTLRFGKVAYAHQPGPKIVVTQEVLRGGKSRPCFVKRSEIEAAIAALDPVKEAELMAMTPGNKGLDRKVLWQDLLDRGCI